MRCPKCGSDAAAERQCARCGVVFSKLVAPRANRRPSSSAVAKRPMVSRGFTWTLALLVVVVGVGAWFIARIPPLPAEYGLLPIDETTVTASVVERAKTIAAEHPDVSVLKQYVNHAQLMLALRYSNERRFVEAEAVIDDAEQSGAPPGEAAAFRAFVLRNQQRWDEASLWAEKAVALDARTNPSEMHHIIGKTRYYREDLSGAIEELEKALAIRDRESIRTSLEAAKRDARIAGSYARLESPHFVIRYDGATMQAPSRLAVETLEGGYHALVSEMGFEPVDRISVVLYTRDDYLAVGGHHQATGLYDGKIRVSVADIDSNEAWIRTTLRHELAHAFVRARAANHVPSWLNEGVAEYVVGARTEQLTRRLNGPVREGSLVRCVLDEACERATFYRASASFVDYLVKFRGMVAIRDVFDSLKRGTPIDAALQRVFGGDTRGLARDWEGYVARQLR